MFIRKLYVVIGLVLALGFFFEIVAHAQDVSHNMIARSSAPVQNLVQVERIGTYRYKPTEFLRKTVVSSKSSLVTLRASH